MYISLFSEFEDQYKWRITKFITQSISKMAAKIQNGRHAEIESASNEIQLYLFNCTFLMHKCIYHSSKNEKTNINNILEN